MTSLSSPSYFILFLSKVYYSRGVGRTPYDDLYGEVLGLPPEWSFFLSLQVYKWIGISTVEYIKGRGKLSFFLVFKKPKGITDVRAVKD